MHHELRAGAAVGVVIGVRVAKVKGEIVVGVRIQLGRADRVEALRSLAVALLLLRPKLAGPAADRIGLQQRKPAIAIALLELELRFLLVDPDQDRIALRDALLGHQRHGGRRDRSQVLVGPATRELVAACTNKPQRNP